jgi:AcrR family transcriptional regulator
MTHDLNDPRVQRTRKLLRDALIALAAERGFEEVTVGDIVGRAQINRATFYRHYQDKYALVEEIFQEAIDQLRRDLKPPSEGSLNAALQDPPQRLVRLFEHFAEHKHLYRTLLGGKGSSWFTAKMRSQMTEFMEQREQLLHQLQGKKPDTAEIGIPKLVGLTLASNLLLSTIIWWLENGQEYSPKQMASWFIEFVMHGYVRILGL